jgi:hypothetical protein
MGRTARCTDEKNICPPEKMAHPALFHNFWVGFPRPHPDSFAPIVAIFLAQGNKAAYFCPRHQALLVPIPKNHGIIMADKSPSPKKRPPYIGIS